MLSQIPVLGGKAEPFVVPFLPRVLQHVADKKSLALRNAASETGLRCCLAAVLLLYCCFTAALLLLYCCDDADEKSQALRNAASETGPALVKHVLEYQHACFTSTKVLAGPGPAIIDLTCAALLLLYCCFTAALLLRHETGPAIIDIVVPHATYNIQSMLFAGIAEDNWHTKLLSLRLLGQFADRSEVPFSRTLYQVNLNCTKCTCFTSTKVQILTLARLAGSFTSTKVQILTLARLAGSFTSTKVQVLTLARLAGSACSVSSDVGHAFGGEECGNGCDTQGAQYMPEL